jgi:hypothetical protein
MYEGGETSHHGLELIVQFLVLVEYPIAASLSLRSKASRASLNMPAASCDIALMSLRSFLSHL